MPRFLMIEMQNKMLDHIIYLLVCNANGMTIEECSGHPQCTLPEFDLFALSISAVLKRMQSQIGETDETMMNLLDLVKQNFNTPEGPKRGN